MQSILFSKKEIQLLKEESFFRTKRIITEKIFHQLSETVKAIQSTSSFKKIPFPKGTDISTGKITKGENYLGLPFIILDFPRLFSSERMFAFRTMVWWGNFASCTLLISGEQLSSAKENLLHHLSVLKRQEVSVCVNASPWLHHFENENFLSLHLLSKKETASILARQEFLKVARKIPVSQINRLPVFSAESFELFARLVTEG
ncbi:MAG TPA: hypothetical protein VE978_24550 [Chitinophagales bacterium]|nr:hypothetical protein [Chitinophagales bacterium]